MFGQVFDVQVGRSARAVFVLIHLKPLLRPLRQRRLAAQRLEEAAVRVEYLDALVAPVGDAYQPAARYRHGAGAVELPFAFARFAERRDEFAVRRELLHAVVSPVGDVDAAFAVDRRAPWQVELARAAARFAERRDEFAVRAHLADAVGVLLDDVNRAVRADCDSGGPAQRADFVRAAVRAPLADEAAAAVEHLDLVQRLVRHVQIVVRAERHAHRRRELVVAGSGAGGELAEPVFFVSAYLDADAARVQPAHPIHHEDAPVRAEGGVVWVVEPATDGLVGVESYRLEIFHRGKPASRSVSQFRRPSARRRPERAKC